VRTLSVTHDEQQWIGSGFLNWWFEMFKRGREYASGIFLKSSAMASKLVSCFFVFDCEVMWGASIND